MGLLLGGIDVVGITDKDGVDVCTAEVGCTVGGAEVGLVVGLIVVGLVIVGLMLSDFV